MEGWVWVKTQLGEGGLVVLFGTFFAQVAFTAIRKNNISQKAS